MTIIVNGELADMPLQNLYQLLYDTPVDRLKNVEIMYSAPAKYHVNGAIINVVLKTPSPLDGLQGQARAGDTNQAHYASYGGGLAATYAVGDWTFDLNYGLSQTKSWNQEEAFQPPARRSTHNDRRQYAPHQPQLGQYRFASASWKTLKLTYNGQIVSGFRSRSLSSGTLGSFANIYRMLAPVNCHNIALRYTAPSGTTAGGDYTRYSKTARNRFSKMAIICCTGFGQQAENIDRYRMYIDQEHRIGKWQGELRCGIYTFRRP